MLKNTNSWDSFHLLTILSAYSTIFITEAHCFGTKYCCTNFICCWNTNKYSSCADCLIACTMSYQSVLFFALCANSCFLLSFRITSIRIISASFTKFFFYQLGRVIKKVTAKNNIPAPSLLFTLKNCDTFEK